jgi:VIT1/CCC1 family predicted Fe2+/Mn2+ transporter
MRISKEQITFLKRQYKVDASRFRVDSYRQELSRIIDQTANSKNQRDMEQKDSNKRKELDEIFLNNDKLVKIAGNRLSQSIEDYENTLKNNPF